MASNEVTSFAQFDKLIEELEKRPHLANNFKKCLPTITNEWDEVSKKLNLIGPPMRETTEWQRVWRDLKQKVKKKIMHNQAEVNATGGGPYNQILLTPNEQAVANLLNYGNLANPDGKTAGCRTSVNPPEPRDIAIYHNADDDDSNAMADLEPDNAEQIPHKPSTQRSRRCYKANRTDMLMKQTLIQENLFKDVSVSLGDIKTHLKESARYQRKNFELKEKRFKLLKSQINKKDALMEQQREILKLDLEIKRKKLELLESQLNGNSIN